ncbi:unnamed protein product, partial [Urochloa humidicola]
FSPVCANAKEGGVRRREERKEEEKRRGNRKESFAPRTSRLRGGPERADDEPELDQEEQNATPQLEEDAAVTGNRKPSMTPSPRSRPLLPFLCLKLVTASPSPCTASPPLRRNLLQARRILGRPGLLRRHRLR